MAEEAKQGTNENKLEEGLTDIEIAELANNELKKKQAEIDKLKKELAKQKLLSTAPDEEEETLSKEECLKRINDDRVSNYDYAEAVCGLVDIAREEGQPNPLGRDGDKVYDFFKDVLEECDGDKNRFPSVYQARIGNDDPSVAMAYNRRNKRN